MPIPCNTMRLRGTRIRTPILNPIQECLLLDRLGRVAPLPGWYYEETGEEPEDTTVWDRMVTGIYTGR